MTVNELIEHLNLIEDKELPIVVHGKHFNLVEASKIESNVERIVVKETGTTTELCVNIT